VRVSENGGPAVTVAEWSVAAGVLLAVVGAASIVFDALQGGGRPRFVAYLVGLLLGLAGVGLLLSGAL
jgi:hypothetical protein